MYYAIIPNITILIERYFFRSGSSSNLFFSFKSEASAVKIQEQITFAEDSLDNIKVQAEHLNAILDREPDELPKVEKFVAKENKTFK